MSDFELIEKLADEHDPFEGQGGGIECACGYPTRDDFDPFLGYVHHIITVYKDARTDGMG